MRFRDRLRNWYEGTFEPYSSADHENGQHLIGGGYPQRHWTARIARSVVEFCCAYWRWILSAVLVPIAVAWMFQAK